MMGSAAFTVYRDTNTQQTVKGVLVDDVRQTLTFRGTIQHMSAIEVVENGGADSDKESIKIYTTSRLIPIDTAGKKRGDHVGFDGKLYEVKSVQPFKMPSTMAHYKAVAELIDSELP